ncbi:MAG: hypothetical protein ABI134_03780 [Byssovorax sp.]
MQRAIAVPLVWMLLFGAFGAYLGIQWWIVVPFVLASGALLYSSYSRYRVTERSIPGSYLGKRAGMVFTLTVETAAFASVAIDAWGPMVGLRTFRAQSVFVFASMFAAWAICETARKAWPAGSD